MINYELTEAELKARDRVALALDVPSAEEAIGLARNLYDLVGLYKIGMELFTSEGPAFIRAIKEEGGNVFLDLKYHDIPNTVRGASRAATKAGVDIFNVHATGGPAMMKAAVGGAEEGSEKYNVEKPNILGVTILTSLDEATYLQTFRPLLEPPLRRIDFTKYIDIDKKEEELQEEFEELKKKFGLEHIVEKQVLHLAETSDESLLDGIVCSAADLYAVRDHLREDFMYVTPGVRGPRTKAGADQKRVFTPGNAIEDGSSILVIGRAITDPERKGHATYEEMRQAAYEILQDMAPHM